MIDSNRKSRILNITYSIPQLILMFFIFALAGWLWEVSFNFYETGSFTNRGFLSGPWLPIYGTGGMLVLLILKRFFSRPLLLFLLSMVICSILEYFTGLYLEYTQGYRWWDYSNFSILHLHGRICLEGTLFFGAGCCIIVYFAAPFLGKLINKISFHLQVTFCIILIVFFMTDMFSSQFHPNKGNGITSSYDITKNRR